MQRPTPSTAPPDKRPTRFRTASPSSRRRRLCLGLTCAFMLSGALVAAGAPSHAPTRRAAGFPVRVSAYVANSGGEIAS
ncbi:YncE family protein, partial [Streptomyces sp. NPDC001793]